MKNKAVVPIIIVTLAVAGVLAFFLNQMTLAPATSQEMVSKDASAAGGTMPEGSPLPEDGGMIGGDAVANDGSMMKDVSYSGEVIAGSETPYIRYNRADFDRALSEGKSVYVYVYATWCPTCAAERPKVMQAFNELGETGVVGFEAHWNDGQNTQEDNDFERNYGVTSQHTSLFIGSDGKLVEKSLNTIEVGAFKAKLAAFGA
ncbi:MAG: hypothetical protein HY833_02495 [Candidatus Aenigmarchaeota archaeon]|nr:hypothetical protein [Candidatus Aenigmarchaeota archaeon]